MSKHKGYSIHAAKRKAEILIYGIIGASLDDEDGISAKEFVEELSRLKDVSEITIRLNSPGGGVDSGKAIYNALLRHPAAIHVAIEGAAYSIASLVAMAGDTISIAENAMMMIHDPYSLIIGNAVELRKRAEMMDKAKVSMITSYKRHVRLSDYEISEAMTAETWYTAEEAVAAGFATEITEEIKIAAMYAPSEFNYKNVPDYLKSSNPQHVRTSGGNDWGHDARRRALDLEMVELTDEEVAYVEGLRQDEIVKQLDRDGIKLGIKPSYEKGAAARERELDLAEIE